MAVGYHTDIWRHFSVLPTIFWANGEFKKEKMLPRIATPGRSNGYVAEDDLLPRYFITRKGLLNGVRMKCSRTIYLHTEYEVVFP